LNKEILENQQRYRQRIELYKRFGYDTEKERNFIVNKAEPIYGEILDVGTGKGHLAIALAARGYRLISVDVSEPEQKIARLNAEYLGLSAKIDFRLENAQALSFEDVRFNVVFSVNVLHHLTKPLKVINELIRVTSFGGKIVLSDFTKPGFELIGRVHASEGRKHGFTKANLADMGSYLGKKGFVVETDHDEFQDVLIACRRPV